MTRDDVQAWLDRYTEAWRTYDPEQVRALFAQDVVYRYHPYDTGDDVLTGLDAVVESWIAPDRAHTMRTTSQTRSTANAPSRPAGARIGRMRADRLWIASTTTSS
jgi:hypothetical protein